MGQVVFKKANGDVFLIAERMPDNAFIHARWIGVQTLESIKQGGNHYLNMLREQPCSKLLNDHTELIGPWIMANDWISNEWTPKVRELGLAFMAQVMAPGIYGQMSFHDLHQRIENDLEIQMFEHEIPAREWLLEVNSFITNPASL